MGRKLATKRAFSPRKNVTIYVFNLKNELIDSGVTKEIEEKYHKQNLRQYVREGKLCQFKWYFSRDKDFKIKQSIKSKNPEIIKKNAQERERIKELKKEARLSNLKF